MSLFVCQVSMDKDCVKAGRLFQSGGDREKLFLVIVIFYFMSKDTFSLVDAADISLWSDFVDKKGRNFGKNAQYLVHCKAGKPLEYCRCKSFLFQFP